MNKPSENFTRISDSIPVSMDNEWFEFVGEDHFWMHWRFRVLKKMLKKYHIKGGNMLEIGCGNGVFRTQMEKEGFVLDGCDLNEYALNSAALGKGLLYIYNIFDKNPALLHKYDCIFLMDVIEHIHEDTTFIITACEHAKPGGFVIINVPAYQYLFSRFDKKVGHIRRYNKKMLKKVMSESGLTLLHTEYWGFMLVPVALLRKIFLFFFPENTIKSGIAPPNKFINSIFKFMMRAETILPFSWFAGASLMAIGQVQKIRQSTEQ